MEFMWKKQTGEFTRIKNTSFKNGQTYKTSCKFKRNSYNILILQK